MYWNNFIINAFNYTNTVHPLIDLMKIPSEIISQLGSYCESDRGLGSPLQQMIRRRLTRPLSLFVLNRLVCFIHVFFYTNTELVLLAKGFLLIHGPVPLGLNL